MTYRALTCFRQFLSAFRLPLMHSICLFVFPLKWKERKIPCWLAGIRSWLNSQLMCSNVPAGTYLCFWWVLRVMDCWPFVDCWIKLLFGYRSLTLSPWVTFRLLDGVMAWSRDWPLPENPESFEGCEGLQFFVSYAALIFWQYFSVFFWPLFCFYL